jgi:uncharacterized protein (DUF2164 family)
LLAGLDFCLHRDLSLAHNLAINYFLPWSVFRAFLYLLYLRDANKEGILLLVSKTSRQQNKTENIMVHDKKSREEIINEAADYYKVDTEAAKEYLAACFVVGEISESATVQILGMEGEIYKVYTSELLSAELVMSELLGWWIVWEKDNRRCQDVILYASTALTGQDDVYEKRLAELREEEEDKSEERSVTQIIKDCFQFCLEEEQDVFIENFSAERFLRANGIELTEENTAIAEELYDIERDDDASPIEKLRRIESL